MPRNSIERIVPRERKIPGGTYSTFIYPNMPNRQKNSTVDSFALPQSIRGSASTVSTSAALSFNAMNKTFPRRRTSSVCSSSTSSALNSSSPVSQSASLRQAARAAVVLASNSDEPQQERQPRQQSQRRKTSKLSVAAGTTSSRKSSATRFGSDPTSSIPRPVLANLHVLQALLVNEQQQSNPQMGKSCFSECDYPTALDNNSWSLASPSSLSIAERLTARIQYDLAEIKRKNAVPPISQFTLTCVAKPAVAASSESQSDASAGNNNGGVSVGGGGASSLQLAAERDQHRQRLDEVWRCAQGWKARCKATEDCLRKLTASLLSAELSRFCEVEERYRVELVAREQSERQEQISIPLVQLLNRQLAKWAGHKCGASSSNTSARGAGNGLAGDGAAEHHHRHHHYHHHHEQNTLNVMRVKDSELLRALRAAESKLAQLGVQSNYNPHGTSAGSFHFV